MLSLVVCLGGIFLILLLAEILWKQKILKGENQRKFVHISSASFIAFWPWLISWKAIQIIGVLMTVILLVNRSRDYLHILGDIRTRYYGDVFLGLTVVLTALITTDKVFFAVAILHVALADGFAAVIGTNFGRKWKYKIFGQTKTVVGTMVFWLVSLSILGVGVLATDGAISYSNYALLLVFLPPTLALIENVSIWGLDNITLPLAVIAALNLASA